MEYSNYTKLQFGTRLQEIRIKRGYRTQTEFAEKLGVSFASVNRWENGGYEPTMKVKRELMKLMKEYKVVEE